MPASRYQNLDLRDGHAVAQTLSDAAHANRTSPLRCGSTAHLPAKNHNLVWMTGDLHDHALNLQRIVHLADLENNPDDHLVLHEMIHGPHLVNGMDLSIRMLARVAALKTDYPDRVHLLLSNHELAQMLGTGILKNAQNVIESFNDGIDFLYHNTAEAVRSAFNDYVASLLLAVRTPNGILLSHSLPSPRAMPDFDATVIDRELTADDLANHGSAHTMVWGRHQTAEQINNLAQMWNVHYFIVGHQSVDMGFEMRLPNFFIMASNHDHGQALPIELDPAYDANTLARQTVPLASVSV